MLLLHNYIWITWHVPHVYYRFLILFGIGFFCKAREPHAAVGFAKAVSCEIDTTILKDRSFIGDEAAAFPCFAVLRIILAA